MSDIASPHRFHIRIDGELAHPQVLGLLREHLAGMHAESPPDKVYALDLSGLRLPEVTFLTAWRRAPLDSSDAPRSATKANWSPWARSRNWRRPPPKAATVNSSPCAPPHAACGTLPQLFFGSTSTNS
jgi:hypothetical protein